jgi:hypothetical protein
MQDRHAGFARVDLEQYLVAQPLSGEDALEYSLEQTYSVVCNGDNQLQTGHVYKVSRRFGSHLGVDVVQVKKENIE